MGASEEPKRRHHSDEYCQNEIDLYYGKEKRMPVPKEGVRTV